MSDWGVGFLATSSSSWSLSSSKSTVGSNNNSGAQCRMLPPKVVVVNPVGAEYSSMILDSPKSVMIARPSSVTRVLHYNFVQWTL